MAYTKLTDYAAKDLLLHGDPAKVVKGTELGAEFDSLAIEDALNVKIATKDATDGVAGLTLFKINFKNAANTFTSFFTNANTAARTYTFPDKDLTVAGIVDLTATNTENTPAGNIASVTVQAAINELDTEKAALAGSASQAFSVAAGTLAAHAFRTGQVGSQISGWTYSNNVGDAINDIDIAAGSGLDSTRAYFISGAALTKQSDVAWAVGTNAGMLDTGAVGDSDYYLWVIVRSDTGVVDYLSSLSSTAPSMPASYDYKRLIGWFKRVGGTIVAFHTYETAGGGIELNWDTPTLDINLANTLTTARRTDAVKVPLNISTIAKIWVFINDATTGGYAIVYNPDCTDITPSASVANSWWSAGGAHLGSHHVITSSTGTIAARSTVATTDNYLVNTVGFIWGRRA